MEMRNTILIVDDMEVNRAILCSLFEEEYCVLEAENGAQALEVLEKNKGTVAVMLLDIIMPEMDGYEVLRVMSERRYLSTVPVVVITAEASAESELHAFDYGASDIITKPFEPHLVRRRVMNIIDLYQHKLHLEDMVAEQAAQLRESNEVLTDALSSVIEYRSLESGQHIRRIRLFTKILMQNVSDTYQEYHMDPQEIDVVARASSMHDIGKIAIPDSILNKPGKLTKEEFDIMKTHTTKGCEILEGLEKINDKQYLQYAYFICRYHHERWDGRGYPDGLREDEIPVYAQVVGIADCYDALTTNRVYKGAYSSHKASEMILNGECGAFSPKLLKCFENVREQFAKLAKDYADGLVPKPPAENAAASSPVQAGPSVPVGAKRWQLKYNAIIRYLHATVLEINPHSGRFEIAYTPTMDFDLLRTEQFCGQALEHFTDQCVHPDDRGRLLHDMDVFRQQVKEKAVKTQITECRVYHKETDSYLWYRAALLHADTDSLNSNDLIMVWTDLGQEEKLASESYEEGRYTGIGL